MILAIGEILFDIFPKYKRLGGAAFNFAFHLKNLGIPVRFFTRVGYDAEGGEIIKKLKQYQFRLDDVQTDKRHTSGKAIVNLDRAKNPQFNILPNVAYDYIALDRTIRSLLAEHIELIYYGSLIQRTQAGFTTIQKLLNRKPPGTKCLYDMNLRPKSYNTTAVLKSLEQANILKLSETELEITRRMLGNTQRVAKFIKHLMRTYDIEMVALTKGKNGSELYTKKTRYNIKGFAVDDVVDRAGAGDAYAAMLATGYVHGWPPEKILSNAARLATQVCRIKGAVPVNNNFYEAFT